MRSVFPLAPLLPCLLAVAAAAAAVDPGEILLSEMNCVACHAAEPAVQQRLASRQAPRLGRQGVRIAPGHLRAFLESPVATKPGTLMPDTLHAMDPAKKAAVAESLTHYLISLEDPQAPRAAAASSAVIQEGKRLYHSVGCVQCHAPQELPATAAALPTAAAEYEQLQQSSVPLGPVAEKYSVGALAGFLRDPLQARPAGRMPSLKLSEAEARAIAMYLLRAQVPGGLPTRLEGLAYDYYEMQLPELPEFDRLEPKTSGVSATFTLQVAERKNDFALRFRGTLMAEKAGEYKFWTRSDDGSRLSIDGQALVENGGVHPAQDRDGKVQLAAGEHVIEVTYYDAGGNSELAVQWQPPGGKRGAIPAALLSHEGQPMVPTAREGAGAFVVDALKAAQGAQHYVTLQCAQCHGPLPAGLASGDVALPKAKPLAQLRARQPAGCLSPKPSAKAPQFDLNDRQRVVLLAALQNQAVLTAPLEPAEVVRRTMTTLNCYACHARDRRGGPEGLRREYLTSVGEVDLGDEGRVPPALTGVGAKLLPDWTRAVLTEGAAVRPYMATRMPQFGPANVGALPGVFEQADAIAGAPPQPDCFAPGMAADANKFGRRLIGTTGLSCIACHMFAGNKSLGVPALDISLSGQRLKWDWFRRYLLDPQALRPGTRMPAFWQNGKSAKTDLQNGDAEKQILSIWSYLARKNFTDLPPGLVMGQQELVAENEAIIYRNFIEGGGPRAIGVGYPEKANLAFNADDLRLAMIWQGAFIDAAKHRSGRGQGFEKPLGTNVVYGPPGPPFAALESDSSPWPTATGPAAGYQFRGYHLDAQRRPAFRYSFGAVDVEDFPKAIASQDEPSLQRTLTLHAAEPVERLYFRAAVAGRIVEKDGTFLIGETLRMKFPGAQPIIRTTDGKAELLVPIVFAEHTAKLVQEIAW